MKKLNEYLGIQQAAEYLGVCTNTLRKWGKSGKLLPYRNPINKYRLYEKEDLDKILSAIKE